MRKLFIILICLLLLNTVAYAQTREEFAGALVDTFNLQGDIKGLYSYSDWLQISKPLRGAVAAANETGVFAPPKGPYRPAKIVDADDIAIAARGLDKLIFLSDAYVKELGVCQAVNDKTVSIKTDSNTILEFPKDTPLMYKDGIYDCSQLELGQLVCLAVDSDGKVVFAWEQKFSFDSRNLDSYEIVGVRRGSLYVFDDPRFMFIMTSPEERKLGNWVDLGNKYDDLLIHDRARVVYKGQDIERSAINEDWLDRKINYVVGKNRAEGYQLKILHVEYE